MTQRYNNQEDNQEFSQEYNQEYNQEYRRVDRYRNRATLEIGHANHIHTITSNAVEAQKIAVRVEKYEDIDWVFEGDTITYTIKLCNECGIELADAIFVDNIPEGLRYEFGSFKVNGHIKNPHISGRRITYKLAKFDRHSEVIITFKVKVL